jgi:putative protease
LQAPLKPGDGVVFDAGHPENKEEGGRVYEVKVGQASRLPVPAARKDAKLPRRVDSELRPPRAGETPALPCQAKLRFGRGDVDVSRIRAGDRVWKTSDPELDRRLRATFQGDQPRFQRPVRMEVHGRVGQPLTLTMRDEIGHVVQVESALPLARAAKQPLTTERLREQLGRLGGTAFALDQLKNHLEGDALLPVSELNRLRRDAVNRMESLRAQPKRWTLNTSGFEGSSFNLTAGPARPDTTTNSLSSAKWRRGTGRGGAPQEPLASTDRTPLSPGPLPALRCGEKESTMVVVARCDPAGQCTRRTDPKPDAREPELVVLVRKLAQLEAALRCGVRTLYCELEDPKKYREAVALVKEAGGRGTLPSTLNPQPSTLFVAPPRIFKTGEEWILKQVRSCEADGYLVRNYDHLTFFADCRCMGDFSLNVANALAADYLVNQYGLERVTASYDLNITQLEALLQSAPPEWLEITIHQHMPMFHMEHCVFCAFLSTGTDYTNCGRPCDRHDVQLRDRVGALHPLKADAGCRNTVFNALAQTGAEFVSRMLALGARRFRIEFLKETPEQVAQTIGRYRQLLCGEISGAQLWKELKLLNQLGVTRGSVREQ